MMHLLSISTEGNINNCWLLLSPLHCNTLKDDGKIMKQPEMCNYIASQIPNVIDDNFCVHVYVSNMRTWLYVISPIIVEAHAVSNDHVILLLCNHKHPLKLLSNHNSVRRNSDITYNLSF